MSLRGRCVSSSEWLHLAALRLIPIAVWLARVLLPAIDRRVRRHCRHFIELGEAQRLKFLNTAVVGVFGLLDRRGILLLLRVHRFLNRKAARDRLRRLTLHNLRICKVLISTPADLIWTREFWR